MANATKKKQKRINWKQRYQNLRARNREANPPPRVISAPIAQTGVLLYAAAKAMEGAKGNAWNNIPEKIIPRNRDEWNQLLDGVKEVGGNVSHNKMETVVVPLLAVIGGRMLNRKYRAPGITDPIFNKFRARLY